MPAMHSMSHFESGLISLPGVDLRIGTERITLSIETGSDRHRELHAAINRSLNTWEDAPEFIRKLCDRLELDPIPEVAVRPPVEPPRYVPRHTFMEMRNAWAEVATVIGDAASRERFKQACGKLSTLYDFVQDDEKIDALFDAARDIIAMQNGV